MLDLIGTVTLIATIIVCLGMVAGALPAGRPRIAALTVGGVWTGLLVALAGAGALLGASGIGPVPPVGVAVIAALGGVAAAAALSPAVRAALLALPTRLLVGLNGLRLLGVFFLLLAAQGRAGGPFPSSAGWGDIVAGLGALALIGPLAGAEGWARLALVWNLFGVLDLVSALALGATSADGSPLQLFHTGIAGPPPVLTLPWSLIPTVLVPFFLIAHAVLFVQLRHGAEATHAPAARAG